MSSLQDLNENLKKYEPESEEIRQSFSKLGEITIPKALPLLIPLAPILTTLLKFYSQTMTINYCYSDTASGVVKVDVTKCITCNGGSFYFSDPLEGADALTKGVVGKVIYLYGFYLVYCMFQDTSLAIKLMAYKIRVKCNKYHSYVFVFFGFVLGFGVSATTALTDPQPRRLSCGGTSGESLYFSEVEAGSFWQHLSFFTGFIENVAVMAGFISLFMALMRDAPGVFVKTLDILSLATKFHSNNKRFLDLKDIKYEVNSIFVHQAIGEIEIQNIKDEKQKILSILDYLDHNKKIFEYKSSSVPLSNVESIALDLFGLTADVHHDLNLSDFVGKKLSGKIHKYHPSR